MWPSTRLIGPNNAKPHRGNERLQRHAPLKPQHAHLWLLLLWLACRWTGSSKALESSELFQQRWFEARTTHFHTYSCGATQEVSKLAARLEQFHTAYSSLAGTQAVASPPIVVIAVPDHDSLQHFVPLYQGKPTSLSGFFHRASDENLI